MGKNNLKVFLMLKTGNITIQENSVLFTATLSGMQIEKIDHEINSIVRIHKMLVIIIIVLVVHILTLKLFDSYAKYEELIDKIQT